VYSELVEDVDGVEEGAGEPGRLGSRGGVWEDCACSSVTVWSLVKFGVALSAKGSDGAGVGYVGLVDVGAYASV
jgi:hypothetical protein